MRFIDINRVHKIAEIINRLVISRKFSFGFLVVIALLSLGAALIQNFILVKRSPTIPVSPLASSSIELRALGVASVSSKTKCTT